MGDTFCFRNSTNQFLYLLPEFRYKGYPIFAPAAAEDGAVCILYLRPSGET